MSLPDVAIIGGGICGLTLALSLQLHGIPCKIYEQRDTAAPDGGAIMLSPNCLRILDLLGVWELVRDEGFAAETFLLNHWDGRVDGLLIGHEHAFGYPALRIHRQILSGALLKLCSERGISILCGKGFEKITEETDSYVECLFKDGSTVRSTFLVGADGIYSRMRGYVDPTIPPASYTGVLAMYCELDKIKLDVPEELQYLFRGPSLIHGRGENGGALTVPQRPGGVQQALIIQRPYPAQDREGWKAVADNHQLLKGLMAGKLDDWPEIVQRLIGLIQDDTPITIWPHHQLPPLKTWVSQKGQVVLLGDAAHAIPPTAGQGANQAIEDAWSFGVALDLAHKTPKQDVIKFWETMRKERIHQVVNLTQRMSNIRLHSEEREKLSRKEIIQGQGNAEIDATKWLYAYKFEDELRQSLQTAESH